MFKRRLAVLGAVGVLVLTGLGGSAMADETPAPTKVTCTTGDGKTVTFDSARTPGKPAGILVRRTAEGGVEIEEVPDGALPPEGLAPTKALPEGAVVEAVPAQPLPEGAKVTATPAKPLPENAEVTATPAKPLAETGGATTKGGGEPSFGAVKVEDGVAVKSADGVPALGKADTISCKSE
ncbi:hypothetical protein [Nonomuraea rhizosphaerae]|uniref:hypothetical protein n=1 Tax=Nonomuraea rhizosphaerae TaxID=2665663 RepID=UPI001C5CD17A|nr:hypothetical protein [Nonomuraea rhizosphaerae]